VRQRQLAVSKTNIVWLIAIIVIGVVVVQAAGWLAGLIAALVVLAISEVVERRRRADLDSGSA
jgi:uncharacterized protein involved in cysteine biosynthesis